MVNLHLGIRNHKKNLRQILNVRCFTLGKEVLHDNN